ncbi:MAG: DUF3375 family protein [Opitutales bacterium]|nr:DUF3375 family protein [Opitutales bacterium]
MGNTVAKLYEGSPTLRLLSAANAPLVLGFFEEAFKKTNRLEIAEEDLELLLERYLAEHAEADPETEADPVAAHRARTYLNLWCRNTHAYLRKAYVGEEQSYVYRLTRHSEKALQWLGELQHGQKAGHMTTESRFSRIFNEFKTLSRQTQADPRARVEDLLRQRDVLDAEIRKIRETGEVETLDESRIKDRLLDLEQMIEAFLADFRSIEDHFRDQAIELQEIHLRLDRSKGDIVAHALDTDAALRESEQGRSYYGFRQMIRSLERREELARYIADTCRLAEAAGSEDSTYHSLMERLLERVTVVQTTYHRIARQLRRVVEETDAGDTRRLKEAISAIKKCAFEARADPPAGDFLEIDGHIEWGNLMEVSFYEPPVQSSFGNIAPPPPQEDADLTAAVKGVGKPLDLEGYRRRVEAALATRDQLSLRSLTELHPLTEGAVDILGYLCVAADDPRHFIDPGEREEIDLNRPAQPRAAVVHRILFQSS